MIRSILHIIATALPHLISAINRVVRERKRKQRQEKRDAAAKDPGSMFSSEFAGGRVLADESDIDAASTDKADLGSDGKSE